METSKATTTLLLDTRRIKKNNTYPVKLTVYFEGEKKRYNTGVEITQEAWNKLQKPNLRDDQLKTTLRKLQAKREASEKIIERLEVFSFQTFESALFHDKKVRQSSLVKDLFQEYIDNLNKQGRVGSSSIYNTVLNSITGFKSRLRITDITSDFLSDYEKHLQEKKISATTIGIYLRHLRAIVNVAINKKLLSADNYPFKGFAIPSSRNVKKALSTGHIKALLSYQTQDMQLRQAIDFWLFSYVSNGINFTDICNLKPENIKGDFFVFYRAKTKHTKKRDKRPIKVPLTGLTKDIISRWRTTDPANPYLFPILEPNLNPMQQKYKIQDFIWKVNKQMNSIAQELEYDGKITTYSARHSHSTILKRQGVPTEFIKENLGHSSVITTENYLDDFEDEVKMQYVNKLINL